MFELKIATGNAAFEDDGEISRILRELADSIERFGIPNEARVPDINGNTVGHVRYSPADFETN